MNKILLLTAALALSFYSRSQDYDVQAGTSAEELVNIITGGQLQVSNITFTGHINARGRFWGTSNIGMGTGIILASGDVNNSEGPNNVSNESTSFNTPGDAVLTLLANNGMESHDASTLEFNFIPDDNTMSLKIVFASEEWPEFSNSSYNDVFGVFLSGPGIYGVFPSPPSFPDGATNIAVIDPLAYPPLFISINNINNGNSNNGPCENCQYYIHNTEQYIQYDAFTTVFEISSVVIPNEIYHIKISIGDIGDSDYDSGLFIEAGSLVTATRNAHLLNSKVWMEGTSLKISIPDYQNTNLSIYNMTGVKLFSGAITSNDFSYSLENFPKGIYIISCRTDDKVINTKVMV